MQEMVLGLGDLGGTWEEYSIQAMFQEFKSKHIEQLLSFQGFYGKKQMECTFLFYSTWERSFLPICLPQGSLWHSTQGGLLSA